MIEFDGTACGETCVKTQQKMPVQNAVVCRIGGLQFFDENVVLDGLKDFS